MKKTFHILTAALLLTAGALLTTGCGNDDTAIDNGKDQPAQGRTVMFTATLAPKGDDGGQTRAITVDNQGTATETLNVAWAAGEEIAIYYQKTDGSYATVTATVSTPNPDGSAPFTATLTDAKGGEAKFVYPASLADTEGGIDKNKLMTGQTGTIADISNNFDAATGTGTIIISGTEATLSGKVAMTNQVCICKFSFSYKSKVGDDRSLSEFHGLKVLTPDGVYTVTTTTMGDIYVALLPCTGAIIGFAADADCSDGTTATRTICFAKANNVNLTAGKFYRNLPITLTMDAGKDLSKGGVIANDGDYIYQSNPASCTTNHIDFLSNATVWVDGVNIASNGGAAISCSIDADATIILVGESIVRGSNDNSAIYVSANKTLTIQGNGRIEAVGGKNAPGIGNTISNSSGNIIINGGTIVAQGGTHSPGIGCGPTRDGETISCGTITINGGTVEATGGKYAAGIGCGSSDVANVTLSCGVITINGGRVTATGHSEGGAGIGCGNNDSNNTTIHCEGFTINGGTIVATGNNGGAGIGSGKINDGITGTNDCGAISITGGSVTAHGVGATKSSGAGIGSGFRAACTTISISGGIVEATGGVEAAGIGSGNNGTCGNISISGGTVEATCGTDGAGIGTGSEATCGTIAISGGTIETTGGQFGAGVGSGYNGKFSGINIGVGLNSLIATHGGYAAPIGKSNYDNGSGAVTVDGVTDWTGSATTHYNFSASSDGKTWTLTPKTTP